MKNMESNNVFKYQYSATQNKEIYNIRKKYLPHEKDKLTILRELDRKAQMAGMTESLALGIIGALIFGSGVCFFLDVFVGKMWMYMTLFAVGLTFMISAYPIKCLISRKAKESLTPEIIKLADELIK